MSVYSIVLAIAPAILLFLWIYRKDQAEKEPNSLLAKAFFLGAISIVPAVLAEWLLGAVLLSELREGTAIYIIVENFLTVAVVEEFVKMKAARIAVWKSPAFDHKFDAILYCATSSLGFATIENILYVVEDGAGIALYRALLSVPSHMIDGIIIGYFFGCAKEAELTGHRSSCKGFFFLSVLVPSIEHGIYDSILSTDSDLFLAGFLILVVVTYVWAVWFVKRQSKNDRPLRGSGIPAGAFPDPSSRSDPFSI